MGVTIGPREPEHGAGAALAQLGAQDRPKVA